MAITPSDQTSKRKRALLEVHASQLVPWEGVYVEPEVIEEE